MPDKEAHLRLAEHNQQTIAHLAKGFTMFSDWITTVAFYRALHLVEAAFACDSQVLHRSDHTRRNRVLKKNPKYQTLYRFYRRLWQASNVARYLERQGKSAVATFASYMTPEDVKNDVLGDWLPKIEKHTSRLTT